MAARVLFGIPRLAGFVVLLTLHFKKMKRSPRREAIMLDGSLSMPVPRGVKQEGTGTLATVMLVGEH